MNTHSSPIPLRPDRDALREAAMTSLVRACLNVARAERERFAKSAWPNDRTAELITRAATTQTTLADAQALAITAVHFVASLVPVSAAAAIIARSLQLTFDRAARLSIPTLTLPNAAWLSEALAIPVVQGMSTPGALLEPYKLATLLALTNEFVVSANGEAAMRQVLLENVGPTLDIAMFGTDAAVPGVRPPGILNGIAPLAPSSAASQFDAMVADIGNIAAALAPSSGASQPMLIAAPRQTVALSMGAPRDIWGVAMSAALPDKTVIGVVPAAIATVVEPPRIEPSSNAVLLMDDQPANDDVLAGRTISMFQSDSIALRFILPATWGLRSPSGVAWVENVNW